MTLPRRIEQMQAQAQGSTVFLIHSYTVPEDVYGKVSECEMSPPRSLEPRQPGEEGPRLLGPGIAPVGEDENPRAVRITTCCGSRSSSSAFR